MDKFYKPRYKISDGEERVKGIYLVILNYVIIIVICVFDQFEIFKTLGFEGFLGSFLFHDIPRAYDIESGFFYNPSKVTLFILHLSIIPFILGFIKSNKILFLIIFFYVVIEVVYIGFVSFILGV